MHWQVALTGLPLQASGCTAFTQHTGWTDSKALCWRPRTHPQTLYGAWPAQAHAARRGAPPDTPCTCPAATHRKECLIYILGTEEEASPTQQPEEPATCLLCICSKQMDAESQCGSSQDDKVRSSLCSMHASVCSVITARDCRMVCSKLLMLQASACQMGLPWMFSSCVVPSLCLLRAAAGSIRQKDMLQC